MGHAHGFLDARRDDTDPRHLVLGGSPHDAAERIGLDVRSSPLPEEGSRELRNATRAFNLMQERLRRFVDDRTLMLAAISHDLRTMLTRLKLRAEVI